MKAFISFLFILSLGFSAQAQWQKMNGPSQNDFYCSAATGVDLFIGGNGIYYSHDEGATWEERSNGLIDRQIIKMVFFGTRLYAVSYQHNLFFSDDLGLNWHLCGYPIYTITAGSDYLFAITDRGFERSADGINWQLKFETNYTGTLISIDASGQKVFVPDGGGFYRSLDNGEHWSSQYVSSAHYFGPFTFTGSYILSAGNGSVYRTQDDGETWESLIAGTYNYRPSLGFHDGRCYAWLYFDSPVQCGLYYSDDYCNSWTHTQYLQNAGNFCFTSSKAFVFDYDPYSTLSFFYSSADEGLSWDKVTINASNSGISNFDVNGYKIVTTNSSGIFLSYDRGNTWQERHLGGYGVYSLLISGNALLAGLNGIYRSLNDGLTWDTALYSSLMITSLVQAGTRIYAGGYTGNQNGGAFYSDDNGVTWHEFNNGLAPAAVYDLKYISGKIYAATDLGVYVSDGSSAWSLLNNGMFLDNVQTVSGNSQYLLAAGWTYAGYGSFSMYHSENQGGIWNLSDFTADGNPTSFAESGNKTFYSLNSSTYQVYMTDDGKTWSVINSGLPTDLYITHLKVGGDTLYASTFSDVSTSGQGGMFKRAISECIPFRPAADTVFLGNERNSTAVLVLNSSTPWLIEQTLPDWYSVNYHSGNASAQITFTAMKPNLFDPPRFFTMEIKSMGIIRTVVVAQAGRIAGTGNEPSAGIKIYPNPTAGIVQISAPGFSQLTFSDITGKTVISRTLPESGTAVDLSSLVNGIYYLKISGEKGIITRKIIKE